VQLGLYQFQSSIPGQFEQETWAAMALVTNPLIVVYLQDQFVKAFANTRLKRGCYNQNRSTVGRVV